MELMPKWKLTQGLPAFYDSESFTALEGTYKVYNAMNQLIEEYNAFAESVNLRVSEFTAKTEKEYKVFQTELRQEYEDFIDTIDLKIQEIDTNFADLSKELKTEVDNYLLQMKNTLVNEVKNTVITEEEREYWNHKYDYSNLGFKSEGSVSTNVGTDTVNGKRTYTFKGKEVKAGENVEVEDDGTNYIVKSKPITKVDDIESISPSDDGKIITSSDVNDPAHYIVKKVSDDIEEVLSLEAQPFTTLKFNPAIVDNNGSYGFPAGSTATISLMNSNETLYTLTITTSTSFPTITKIVVGSVIVHNWTWKKDIVTAEEVTGISGDTFVVKDIVDENNILGELANVGCEIICYTQGQVQRKELVFTDDVESLTGLEGLEKIGVVNCYKSSQLVDGTIYLVTEDTFFNRALENYSEILVNIYEDSTYSNLDIGNSGLYTFKTFSGLVYTFIKSQVTNEDSTTNLKEKVLTFKYDSSLNVSSCVLTQQTNELGSGSTEGGSTAKTYELGMGTNYSGSTIEFNLSNYISNSSFKLLVIQLYFFVDGEEFSFNIPIVGDGSKFSTGYYTRATTMSDNGNMGRCRLEVNSNGVLLVGNCYANINGTDQTPTTINISMLYVE